MSVNYHYAKRINLKNNSEINELWIQNLIEESPEILGLGELVVRDRERRQPGGGRLDLLLQSTEPNSKRRYVVELQLGACDPSHIIRAIEYWEYWDIESKRYPQYDHCAVLIAEDITSRFLNVISLFNGTLPLIAIQMQAYEVGEHTTLIFTKVLDELVRGLVDEDEDAESAPSDRNYWIKKASKDTLNFADELLTMLKHFDSTLNLKYNKFYIGLERGGRAYNFVIFRPKKKRINFELRIPQSSEIDKIIDDAEIDTLDYDETWKRYRLSLAKKDLDLNGETLKKLSEIAYSHHINS